MALVFHTFDDIGELGLMPVLRECMEQRRLLRAWAVRHRAASREELRMLRQRNWTLRDEFEALEEQVKTG